MGLHPSETVVFLFGKILCEGNFKCDWIRPKNLWQKNNIMQKKFKCGQCSSTFAQRYKLQAHKWLHTGFILFTRQFSEKF